MAGFTPLAFTDVRDALAELYASQSSTPANDAPGSTVGAIWNAVALVILQQQQNIVYAQAIARLATASGADVDSFVAPFGITRLAASPSSGAVLCSCPSPVAQQVVIPIGVVLSASNGLLFTVVADTTNPAYSQSSGGYVIASGQSSVSVTVQCQTAGTVGNVQANQITTIAGSTPAMPANVTSVTNAAAFTNAIDQESDAALKARFTLRMSSGVVATSNALAAALLAVQAGLTYTIADQLLWQVPPPLGAPTVTQSAGGSLAAETDYVAYSYTQGSNETPLSPIAQFARSANNVLNVATPPQQAGADGWNVYVGTSSGSLTKQNSAKIAIGTNWTEPTTGLISGSAPPSSNDTTSVSAPGYATVFLNESGQNTGPSTTLVNAVQAALDNARSAGINVTAYPPTLVAVNVTATLHVPSAVSTNAMQTAAQTAVEAYLNGIGLDPAGATTYAAVFNVGSVLAAVKDPTSGLVATRVDSVQLNSGTSDISAPLGSQLVAGTVTITVTSP